MSSGSTSSRGYGSAHQALRKEWARLVDSGGVRCHARICLMPSRRIPPGAPWDLGHTEDRTGYTGPEHRSCNRADGGRRRRRGRPPVPENVRRWLM